MSQSETSSRMTQDSQVQKVREVAREGELVGLSEPQSPSKPQPQAAVQDSPETLGGAEGQEQSQAPDAAHERTNLRVLGERSLERIEQIHLENLRLAAERDRLREELAEARQRAENLEELNLQLDHQIAQFEAERMQLLELQQQLDRRDAVIGELRDEVRRREKDLRQQQDRSDQVQRQLRAIGQERADRVAVLRGHLRAVQKSNAELERQVEELIAYRQRASTCFQQIGDELRSIRRENRTKSRRLAEARAVLQDIDRRLGEEI
jgi:chromosome segregation ATPase